MSQVVRRNSSEYSEASASSVSGVSFLQQNFTKQEKSKGRSKVYGLLLTEPMAIGAFIPTIISGGVPVVTFLFLGNILNEITSYSLGDKSDPDHYLHNISLQLIYMTIVTIFVAICKFVDSLLWSRVGSKISTKIKDEIFTHIMTFDVAFYDTHSIGSLLTVLGEDSAVIQECFGTSKGLQVQNLGQFLVGWILTMVYSWKLGLIMLCIVPVVVVLMLIFHPYIDKCGRISFIYTAKSVTIADETISAIRTVRGFNCEESDAQRYVKESTQSSKYQSYVIFLLGGMFSIVMIVIWGAVDAMLYYASTLVGGIENGRVFQAGTMFSCFGYSMMGSMGIVALENSIQAEQRAITASSRIIALTSYKPEINFDGGKKIENFKGHIEFKNVTFSYPTRPNVLALNNVSFEVNPGDTVALVGHSGSGKSTCVQLMERYYDCQEGQVLYDGVDIKELDPHWLHRQIALVSQEPTLFMGTVRDNVLYGVSEKQSDDDVWNALEQANAKKFVTKFDDKLDQMIGDKGSTISGGQKQRIAIARAVIKNPSILICDEATSALDSESEKKVQVALDKILETRTGVIVAHRLTTIKNADKIYVFDAGAILEVGKHDELVAKGGAYYNLVKRQLQKAEVESTGKKKENDNKDKDKEEKESSSSSTD